MHVRAVQRLLLLVALLPGLTLVSSCKTRGFQTSSITKPADKGALERWKKAQDSLIPVQETVQRAGTNTEDGQAYLSARKAYTPKRDFELKAGVVDIRPELVALSASDGLRDILESSVIAEQRRRSALLKETVFGSQSAQKYDTIIVGAGPHAAALVQEFTDREPTRSILVVDAASRPGGTFAEVGPVFALNSTNREDTGEQANVGRGQAGGAKGDGNLNAVADLIGIPDLSGLKWPLAGDLGYVTTLAVEYSSAQVLLNTRVSAVGSTAPDRAFVRLEDGATPGRTVEVEAQQVILATGIGKPSFFLPRKEQDRARLAASASETKPPVIMLFGEFVRRVNEDLRNKRNPMLPYVDKRILVVGAGDSGKVVLEWLAGLGPDSRSYGPAQVGEPRKIVWSGVDFLTCQEFLKGARARYSRIAQPLNSSLIALAPVRIKNFSAPTDGKSVTITDFELQDKKAADGSRNPLLSSANLSDSDRKPTV